MAIVPTYTPNIPQATDEPSQSQPRILDNFTGINVIWDVNHYAFNEANAGKHRFCQFPVQVAAPTTSPTEVGLYSFTNATTTNPELYIVRHNNGNQIPMTAFSNTAAAGNIGQGYAYLPSGQLLRWGYQVANFAGALPENVTIDMSAPGGPNFAAVPISVQFTVHNGINPDPNLAVYLQTIDSVTQFTLRFVRRDTGGPAPANGYAISWLAIGRGV